MKVNLNGREKQAMSFLNKKQAWGEKNIRGKNKHGGKKT
jgi:hypothetical protein